MNSEKEKRYLVGEEDLPIVLMHGTMGKSEDWSRVVEELSHSRSVLRPDYIERATKVNNAHDCAVRDSKVKAVGDSSRNLLYDQLAQDQGVTPANIGAGQQLYGQLSNVADIANKRDAVFFRHDPVSLAEKVATGHGGPVSRLTNYIAQKGLRSITDSDALVGSAVDRFQNPIETPATPSNNPILAGVSRLGSAIYLEGDEDFFDLFRSPMYWNLRQTFMEDCVNGDSCSLLKMVWRAYKAGKASPDRLIPDTKQVRMERAQQRRTSKAAHKEYIDAMKLAKELGYSEAGK
jgi:hypothetical protein